VSYHRKCHVMCDLGFVASNRVHGICIP
jgi:hypothetical protein